MSVMMNFCLLFLFVSVNVAERIQYPTEVQKQNRITLGSEKIVGALNETSVKEIIRRRLSDERKYTEKDRGIQSGLATVERTMQNAVNTVVISDGLSVYLKEIIDPADGSSTIVNLTYPAGLQGEIIRTVAMDDVLYITTNLSIPLRQNVKINIKTFNDIQPCRGCTSVFNVIVSGGSSAFVNCPHASNMGLHIVNNGKLTAIAANTTTSMSQIIDGSGEIKINGTTQEHGIFVRGSAVIRAPKFKADVTIVDIKGAAELDLAVQHRLSGVILGADIVRNELEPVLNIVKV